MWCKCHFGRNIATRNSLGPNNHGKYTVCKLFNVRSVPGQCVTCSENDISGCFPCVRTDRPSHFCHNENFTFNQNNPTRAVKSCSIHEGDGFSSKTLGKSLFCSQNDWSGHDLASQFWLLKSTLNILLLTSCKASITKLQYKVLGITNDFVYSSNSIKLLIWNKKTLM